MGTKTKSYNSAQYAAPALSGTAGALITILDAVLVNGFGQLTATSLSVTSSVATVVFPNPHSFDVGSVALISGSTPAELNGEKRVLSKTLYNITFDATGTADTTATGTITGKVAGAGWSKIYSTTNIAAYKIISVLGTGCILRVDDTGTTTARVRGYESMTDINTGTGLFPTVAQYAAPGLWWSKSNVASAAVRPWRIVADDRGVYFFPKNADTASEYQGNYFGDIISLRTNDPYSCVLRANVTDKSASVAAISDSLEYMDQNNSLASTYIARNANSLGSAIALSHNNSFSVGSISNGATGSGGLPYPSYVDNGLTLSQLCLYGQSTNVRGYFPGIRVSNQLTNTPFATGDTISGSGDMVGKTVTVIKLGSPTATTNQGVVFMDQVSDWR